MGDSADAAGRQPTEHRCMSLPRPRRPFPRAVLLAASIAVGLLVGVAPPADATPVGHGRSGGTVVWSRFDDTQSGTARIVRADPSGRHVHPITAPPAGFADIDPMVSPDGRRVLFERDDPQGVSRIGVVGMDGRGERMLPLPCSDPCVNVLSANWLPDGRHLIYALTIGPFDGPNEGARSNVLWSSDLEGHGFHRVSQPGIDGVYEDYRASFAPGGYVVFQRLRTVDGHQALFRMRPNGAHLHQITPWDLDADLPSVSPARRGPSRDLVVFETYGHGAPDGVSQAIATVPATCTSMSDCTARIRLLTSPSAQPVQNFNPGWSPDGRNIVYCRFSYTDPGPATGDIWRMRWNGAGRRAVSTDPRFEFRPAWGV
jgi:Tol biopolymer transport system component